MLHIEPLQRPGLEVLAPGPFGAFRAMDASRGETTEVRVLGDEECNEPLVVPLRLASQWHHRRLSTQATVGK